jgi:hypothetical protein
MQNGQENNINNNLTPNLKEFTLKPNNLNILLDLNNTNKINLNNNINKNYNEKPHNIDLDNIKEKDNINGKENSNYLKINKLNILKELFNTFEIFNKSDYERNNNSDNDGWIFKREINNNNNDNNINIINNFNPYDKIKEANKDKEINESKSEFNLRKFNRLNFNLNSVGGKNEKFEFSDKHNINKKSTMIGLLNPANLCSHNNLNSFSPRVTGLIKKQTNGSKNNINNDTILDAKRKKIQNEMNTILLTRYDQNETIKYDNYNGDKILIFYF